ncbi:MAG: glycosyltransferase, partial [Oscillochloris sp.]|nr:glycosyltransferase [Oscillochloris sp.]
MKTPRQPETIRVAMLARVVYPLHGFGGIERHVGHLVTHLARLGVTGTLYVQPTPDGHQPTPAEIPALSDGRWSLSCLRYDRTSPVLPPNGIVGRQINYPWYSWQLGVVAASAVRRGAFSVVHSQGLCATGYGAIRTRDALLRRVPFVANPHGMEEFRTPDWRKWLAYAPFRALYVAGHRAADRAIATDACTKDDLPRYLGVDPAKVVVVPSAIDVNECLG